MDVFSCTALLRLIFRISREGALPGPLTVVTTITRAPFFECVKVVINQFIFKVRFGGNVHRLRPIDAVHDEVE